MKPKSDVINSGAIGLFLERLRQFHEREADQGVVEVRSLLQRLKPRLREFQEETKNAELMSAPHFNIFRVLRLAHKEVIVHTPVLGELLNPNGTHSQGFLFLSEFLKIAEEHGLKMPAQAVEKGRWHVETERSVGSFGTVDLLIRCREFGYLLLIENKIKAGEQPDQLQRYFDWLESQRHTYQQRQIIFLTPTGRSCTTLRTGIAPVCMSYHEHIFPWLKKILPQIRASSVHEILKQYITIIEAC
jgi:hypothetical protein